MSGFFPRPLTAIEPGAMDVAARELQERPMWRHLCSVEKDMVATGRGQPCSWCGREEPAP